MESKQSFRAVLLATLLALTPVLASCGESAARVLFLGNSLTYVGNLPAVFSALCSASGHRCATELIAQGGATLTNRVDDNSLARASGEKKFDYVVLQERGGDYFPIPSRLEVTKQAERATETLAQEAIKAGMKPILLGTYQDSPRVSADLVAIEAVLATKLGITHVPVSEHLRCGRREKASLRWFDADGQHPGPELTLLMAALLHKTLFGSYPPAVRVTVNAPMYGPMNKSTRRLIRQHAERARNTCPLRDL